MGKKFKHFKDIRGEIKKFGYKGTSFNLIFTKKGGYRSGDVHKSAQYDMILKGGFEITMRKKNRNVKIRAGKNQLVVIPKNTPHLFRAMKDSVMIEWWNGKFEMKYYWPYRKIVEDSISERSEEIHRAKPYGIKRAKKRKR